MQEGDNLVCSASLFVGLQAVAAFYRCQCIEAPMQGMTHDLDAMLRAITPRTKLVIVANPNPTGTLVDQAPWIGLLSRCQTMSSRSSTKPTWSWSSRKCMWTPSSTSKPAKPVVTLCTFSKAYGLAGLRKWATASRSPTGIDLLNKVRHQRHRHGPAAVLAALDDDEYPFRAEC